MVTTPGSNLPDRDQDSSLVTIRISVNYTLLQAGFLTEQITGENTHEPNLVS
jgi:hypothetical protein